MSTSRGNAYRQRSQKHQNKFAFKNDLHDTSNKTKLLNSISVTGVCKRCKDIIEWKIKYKKYKPLSVPRKCVACDNKGVKQAYHVLCAECAAERNVCAKCVKSIENEADNLTEEECNADRPMVKCVSENAYNVSFKSIRKNQNDEQTTPEILVCAEGLLSEIDNLSVIENRPSEDPTVSKIKGL